MVGAAVPSLKEVLPTLRASRWPQGPSGCSPLLSKVQVPLPHPRSNSPTTSQVPSFCGPATNRGHNPCSLPEEGASSSPFDMLQTQISAPLVPSHPCPTFPIPLSLTPVSSLGSPTAGLTSTPDSFHYFPGCLSPSAASQIQQSTENHRHCLYSRSLPLCCLSKTGVLRVLGV